MPTASHPPIASNVIAPNDTQPLGCTHLKLRQLMRRISKIYDAEVGKSGLKTTQYSLLSYIVKQSPIRAVDLARGAGLDASTLSRNLKPLITAGWITQSAGPDARSRLLIASPSGRAIRTQAQRHWRVAQLRINQLLGSDQVIALHSMIDRSLAVLHLDGEEKETDV